MIFADTSFFYALLAKRDRNHERALAELQEIGAARSRELLLTTNYVVAYRATVEDESAAFAYFEKYADKDYSYVDCLSFVVMLKLGITEALTFDDDFAHRFIVRPGH